VLECARRDTAALHQCENQNKLARNRALIDGNTLKPVKSTSKMSSGWRGTRCIATWDPILKATMWARPSLAFLRIRRLSVAAAVSSEKVEIEG
jgi:hypothetical protein